MTIRNRLRIGFGLLVLLILITVLVIGWYVRSVDTATGEVIDVEEPTSAAAYEMEAALKGTGLGFLKYLETGEPRFELVILTERS